MLNLYFSSLNIDLSLYERTFQRVEKLPGGYVKDVDDSIDSAAGQIFSIRALSGKAIIQKRTVIDYGVILRFYRHDVMASSKSLLKRTFEPAKEAVWI